MGVRRARRAGRQGIPLGRRARARGEHRMNVWQGDFPGRNTGRRRLRGDGSGRRLLSQRLRPPQHDRQRVGVDARTGSIRRFESAIGEGIPPARRTERAGCRRAAPTSVTTPTAGATASRRGRARRPTPLPGTSVSAAPATAELLPSRLKPGRGRCSRNNRKSRRTTGLFVSYATAYAGGRLCSACGRENLADARFCHACGAPLTAGSDHTEERKVVTVLFTDVAGSTALGERLELGSEIELRATVRPLTDKRRGPETFFQATPPVRAGLDYVM